MLSRTSAVCAQRIRHVVIAHTRTAVVSGARGVHSRTSASMPSTAPGFNAPAPAAAHSAAALAAAGATGVDADGRPTKKMNLFMALNDAMSEAMRTDPKVRRCHACAGAHPSYTV
jgi:pyruvate/2-oxoglutarate/acetoin dehydrogenase E1 component